jgi:hypothetical protein
MLLMQTVQDETMPVPGFEHHTFMCSSCHDVEQRLTFAKPREQPNPEAVPVDAVPIDAMPVHAMAAHAASVDAAPLHIAPPISPTARVHEHASGGGMFRRVLSKLRGG